LPKADKFLVGRGVFSAGRRRNGASVVVGRLAAGSEACKVSSSLPSGSLLTSQSELACFGRLGSGELETEDRTQPQGPP
jgi:hypothetical protein